MDFNSVPNRASDAGPDRGDQPSTWQAEVHSAMDELIFARDFSDQDHSYREPRFRRQAISDAIDHLRHALELLPKAVRL